MAAGTSAECFDTEEQQLHEVIRACILHFDASSVVRLCSASKALTETCKTELTAGKKEVAHLVLQKTVNYATALAGEDKMGIYGFTRHKGSAQITANEQAQAPQHQQLVQHMQAVTWLLRTVGTDALFIQTTPSSNKTVNDTIPKLVKLCTEVRGSTPVARCLPLPSTALYLPNCLKCTRTSTHDETHQYMSTKAQLGYIYCQWSPSAGAWHFPALHQFVSGASPFPCSTVCAMYPVACCVNTSNILNRLYR